MKEPSEIPKNVPEKAKHQCIEEVALPPIEHVEADVDIVKVDLAPDPVHPPPKRPDAADPSLRSGNKRRDVELSEEEERPGVLRDRAGSLRGSSLGRWRGFVRKLNASDLNFTCKAFSVDT